LYYYTLLVAHINNNNKEVFKYLLLYVLSRPVQTYKTRKYTTNITK
jgi:hypothetical protein